MDVRSAILEYKRVSPKIFQPSRTSFLGSNVAKTAVGMPWFSGEALQQSVIDIVENRLPWEEKEQLGRNLADARLISSLESNWNDSCKT